MLPYIPVGLKNNPSNVDVRSERATPSAQKKQTNDQDNGQKVGNERKPLPEPRVSARDWENPYRGTLR